MKLKQSVIVLSVAALLVAAPLHAGRQGPGQGRFDTPAQAVVAAPLSSAEVNDLVFMREEEKLSRDVYLTFYELWRNPVFSSISRAEQRHMDSMGRLLANYGLSDPVIDDGIGVFNNRELAGMYGDLTQQGQLSLLDALYAGALIEELDIRDLQDAIATASHPDLIQAYENLQRGSRNHLRAFVRQIEMLGDAYEAQVLDQLEVDMILDSPLERGRSGGNGRRGW
ncbi:MAG: DUF2202 domain-containing protein [Chromatiaceae bacterium]|nr:DUF2202 domain-containing protein [Gammaproteobacteria bacterium]MCP5409716.1 DUF2202 domain-containing protein [Chromatiaceae bacterium]